MNFVNLNPHPMTLRTNTANTAAEPDATDIVVAPRTGEDGKPAPARIGSKPGALEGDLGGVALYGATEYGAPTGLPEPVEGTVYIVSAIFAGRCPGRNDLVMPGTGPQDGAVRDTKGQIYAVTRLIRV